MPNDVKKFIDLRKGDFLYNCHLKPFEISNITSYESDEKCRANIKLEGVDGNTDIEPATTSVNRFFTSRYGDGQLLYTSEYEAAINRKKDLMSQLSKKVENAEKAVKELEEFRSSHYQELNITLTDKNIQELRRKL